MALYTDDGIVLRTWRLGEADRIVSILGRERGKIRAVVKGVRKTKSRFGARLEPFSSARIMLWEGRSELHVVSQAELIESYSALRGNWDATVYAQLMCEAVDSIATEDDPNLRLFRLLQAGLADAAERAKRGQPLSGSHRAAFLLKLLGVSGFAPQVRICVHCGGPDGLMAFSIEEGGVVCSNCASGPDPRLRPDEVAALSAMWSTPFSDLTEPGSLGIDGVIAKVLEYHLDCRLRTLENVG